MPGIDEVILCDNKAKNVATAIVTAKRFNEVSVQKNELKRLGYFIAISKPGKCAEVFTCKLLGKFKN